MSVFCYFIEEPSNTELAPGGTLSESLLAACGLAEVLADCRRVNADVILSECAKGPGGKPGFVVTPEPVGRDIEEPVQFRPNVQTWAEVAGPQQRHWIGWLTDAPPTPADLRRRKQVAGRAVTGASGRHWIIPIARSPVGGATLPRNIVFHGGEPVAKVKPEFAELWEMSGRVWDLAHGSADDSDAPMLTDGDLIRFCMTALGVNYRVGPAEITALAESAGTPLLDDRFLQAANYALIDGQIVDEMQKKTN